MFKDKLKQARLKTGLSQAKLADALGVPLRTYESWERGLRTPAVYVQTALLQQIEQLNAEK